MNRQFILASQSARRQQLLKPLVADFLVIPADIDEHSIHVSTPQLAKEISKLKAYKVFSDHPQAEVLACDTIVVIDHEVLGKPASIEEAKAMLTRLSGRRHKVISGYTLISADREISRTVVTDVYFNQLSDQLIDDYIKTGSPFDKAGGYGIQDTEFKLVAKIVGSYANVMGLPVEDLAKYLGK